MNYDKKKYKIWDWKSRWVIHWMINPAVALPELLIGIAIPKVMLIEREATKPLYLRSIIPCPHCGTLHNGRKWYYENKTAFKNWWGYYCDNCGKIIPIQRNLLTLLFLVVTYPLWGWFRKSMKQRWLKKQPDRFKSITLQESELLYSKQFWIKAGLIIGLFFYTTMILVYPLFKGEKITLTMVIVGVPIYLLAGLVSGFIMKKLMIWYHKKYQSNSL